MTTKLQPENSWKQRVPGKKSRYKVPSVGKRIRITIVRGVVWPQMRMKKQAEIDSDKSREGYPHITGLLLTYIGDSLRNGFQV